MEQRKLNFWFFSDNRVDRVFVLVLRPFNAKRCNFQSLYLFRSLERSLAILSREGTRSFSAPNASEFKASQSFSSINVTRQQGVKT